MGYKLTWVYLGSTKVRPTIVPDYLCFTANTANSKIKLDEYWDPHAVSLETSTDGTTWSAYTFWTDITLSSIGDKVYWRNTSETDTWFNIDSISYYQFSMSWSIAASWDINYLLNKNSTTTVSSWCYRLLFQWCTSLTAAPSLPATTIAESCYRQMFYGCTNLTTIPALPATTLPNFCYAYLFYNCTNVNFSTTQGWSYQTEYRIPTEWTWTAWTNCLYNIFTGTWWSFEDTPSLNTTYYTTNTVV